MNSGLLKTWKMTDLKVVGQSLSNSAAGSGSQARTNRGHGDPFKEHGISHPKTWDIPGIP